MSALKVFKQCRKIIGAAKNFKMVGVDPKTYPSEPALFLKAPTTILKEGSPIIIPEGYSSINFEVELGVVIGEEGRNIREDQAFEHVGGYCISLDMTIMDEISNSAKKGLPWFLGKNFDTFTPVSDLIDPDNVSDPHNVNLWLKLDGKQVQYGNTEDMYFKIPRLISYASKVMTLESGDLILTGTPAGAGLVTKGQKIECGIENVKEMKFEVV